MQKTVVWDVATYFLRKMADVAAHGSVFVALCAVAMVQTTYLILNMPMSVDAVTLFVFFATLGTYNLQRLVYQRRYRSRAVFSGQDWVVRHPFVVLMFTIIGVSGAAIYFFHLSAYAKVVVSILVLLAVVYVFPVVPFRLKRVSLRNLWPWKTLLLAGVWAVATVILPFAQQYLVDASARGWAFVERFLFFTMLTIAFDYRDRHWDAGEQVFPLPIHWDDAYIRYAMMVIGALAMIVSVVHYVFISHQALFAAAFGTSIMVSLLVLRRLKPNTSSYYYYFVVDGLMLMQWLLAAMAAMAAD